MGLTVRSALQSEANVVVTMTDADGRVEERRSHNSFLNQYASFFAQAMAGTLGIVTLPLSHASVGAAGLTIETFESVVGWTGTPVLDSAIFRQGSASFSRAVTASSAASILSPTVALNLSAGFAPTTDSIEIQLLLDVRARLDATGEVLRFTTSVGNYYTMTWATLETYYGSALLDNTWTVVKVPMAGFTVVGAPSWATITSYIVGVTANTNGTLTAHFDDLKLVPASILVDPTQTSVPNQISVIPLASSVDLGGGQVRVKAFWNTSQVVGIVRVLGLYGNGGATLAALVALSPPLVKTNLLSLTVEWTVTSLGG